MTLNPNVLYDVKFKVGTGKSKIKITENNARYKGIVCSQNVRTHQFERYKPKGKKATFAVAESLIYNIQLS